MYCNYCEFKIAVEHVIRANYMFDRLGEMNSTD